MNIALHGHIIKILDNNDFYNCKDGPAFITETKLEWFQPNEKSNRPELPQFFNPDGPIKINHIKGAIISKVYLNPQGGPFIVKIQ